MEQNGSGYPNIEDQLPDDQQLRVKLVQRIYQLQEEQLGVLGYIMASKEYQMIDLEPA